MENVGNVLVPTRAMESRCHALELLLKREMDDYREKDQSLQTMRLKLFVRRNDLSLRKRAAGNRKALDESLSKMNSSEIASPEDQDCVVDALKEMRETISVVKTEIRRCYSQIGLFHSSSLVSFTRDSSCRSENWEKLSSVRSKAVTKEGDLDRVFKKLAVKLRRLQTKEERLISREGELRTRMSCPADSVRVDEVLTESVEAELEILQRGSLRDEMIREDEIGLETRRVEAIERLNDEKRKRIGEAKDRVEELRRAISGVQFAIKKTEWHLGTVQIETRSIEQTVSGINQRVVEATRKQRAIDSTEMAIRDILNHFEKQKEAFQKVFEEKRKTIEMLKSRIQEVKEYKDKIFDMEEEVGELKQELIRQQIRKQQVNGEIQSIAKAMRALESKRSDNARLMFAFGLKQQAIDKKQDRIARRNELLHTRRERLTKSLVELGLAEKKVAALEKDVKLFEDKVQAKNSEVRQLTKVRDTLRS